jgi:hypothetical protein
MIYQTLHRKLKIEQHEPHQKPGEPRRSGRVNSIHLLTGYSGNSTFIVPKVPTIVRGNAEDNSCYRGDNKSDITEYQVYKCFIILNKCAIQNSKL